MNVTHHIGNLTDKPVLRQTNGGKKLCSFDIAVTMGRDKNPLYISITVWDERLAEYCEKYLEKGSKVAVTGSLDYPYAYKSEKSGEARCNIKIKATNVEFLPKGARPEQAQQLPQNIPGQENGSQTGYQRQYAAQPDPSLAQQGFSELDPNEQPPWYNGWMP